MGPFTMRLQNHLQPDIATLTNTSGAWVIPVDAEETLAHIKQDVSQGLAQPYHRWLSPAYFYDAKGAALYEAITALPEYYLTRTEAQLLKHIAPEIYQITNHTQIVELGSGSSIKTRILLDIWTHQSATTYIPIDINPAVLTESTKALAKDYPQLSVIGLAGRYEKGLSILPANSQQLLLFLGSTIGNFSPQQQSAFFTQLHALTHPGSSLLIGFDCQPNSRKPKAVIEAAYNDAQGITAQFNLNMLRHLNHQLDGNFDLSQWAHVAFYNDNAHQIELYLKSLTNQQVTFGALKQQYHFAQDEMILTEISRKYDPQKLATWFSEHGFSTLKLWTDDACYFGLLLLQRRD